MRHDLYIYIYITGGKKKNETENSKKPSAYFAVCSSLLSVELQGILGVESIMEKGAAGERETWLKHVLAHRVNLYIYISTHSLFLIMPPHPFTFVGMEGFVCRRYAQIMTPVRPLPALQWITATFLAIERRDGESNEEIMHKERKLQQQNMTEQGQAKLYSTVIFQSHSRVPSSHRSLCPLTAYPLPNNWPHPRKKASSARMGAHCGHRMDI